MMDLELYKKLTSMYGISGHEWDVKEFVKNELKKYTDEIKEDRLGSVFGVLKGNGPKIVFAGHMDEVGFIVYQIQADGKIKLMNIGGVTADTYVSQTMVIVINQNETIKGIVGNVPPHLTKGQDRKPLEVSDLLLDIGASCKEEAESWGVKIGMQVCSENDFYITKGGKRIISKAWDDRFGVGLAIELAKEASKMEHPNTLIFGGTVQEEVGCRGAQTAATLLEADAYFAIDVSPAGEGPEPQCGLDRGFLIRFYDPSCIMNVKLKDYIEKLAKESGIKFQMFASAGGTDARSFQYSKGGALVTTLGLPARYIHTTGAIASVDDMEAVKKIALLLIKNLDWDTFNKLAY